MDRLDWMDMAEGPLSGIAVFPKILQALPSILDPVLYKPKH